MKYSFSFFCHRFWKGNTDEEEEKNVEIFLETVFTPQYFYLWKGLFLVTQCTKLV